MEEISIDFITDLPTSSGNNDTVLTIIDKATRMVHLVPCRKTITAVATARLLWNTVVRLHGVPRAIFSDRGPQFTAIAGKNFGASREQNWDIRLHTTLRPKGWLNA